MRSCGTVSAVRVQLDRSVDPILDGPTVEAHTAQRSHSRSVELRVLGWPDDSPRLNVDHQQFAYAGNFATGRTGIAVAVEAGVSVPGAGTWEPASDELLAAASFDEDRAERDALRVRYVSVREDRRGEGIGPALLAFVVQRAVGREFDRVRIGVNNPIAYQACYRAGFSFTGEESGMGELVLEAPVRGERSTDSYRDGLERFAERDFPQEQAAVVDRNAETTPPSRIDPESEQVDADSR